MRIALRLDCDYRDRSIKIRRVDLPCTNDWLYKPILGGWIVIQVTTPATVPYIVDYWAKDRMFDVDYTEEGL